MGWFWKVGLLGGKGQYLIGAGGWAYFRTPGEPSLVAYSRMFNFVEVNSTFYEIPAQSEAERWRRLVPDDFEFAVRVHRSITHEHRLQPSIESLENLERLRRISEILRAEVMHFQTPPTLKIDQESIRNLRSLITSTSMGRIRIALELKGNYTRLPEEFVKTMQEYDVIHCVDLLRGEAPAARSDILHSRLFGKGYHNIYQPTDEELKSVDEKVRGAKSEKVMLSFHGLRMYKDAARLKTFKQTGKFPMITRSTGLASLEHVLREDARFPTAREELMRRQGWKLFDLTEEKRIRSG